MEVCFLATDQMQVGLKSELALYAIVHMCRHLSVVAIKADKCGPIAVGRFSD